MILYVFCIKVRLLIHFKRIYGIGCLKSYDTVFYFLTSHIVLGRRGLPRAGCGDHLGGGAGGRGVEQCLGGAGAESTGMFSLALPLNWMENLQIQQVCLVLHCHEEVKAECQGGN
jgi:hypothetical protein